MTTYAIAFFPGLQAIARCQPPSFGLRGSSLQYYIYTHRSLIGVVSPEALSPGKHLCLAMSVPI